MPMVTKLGRMLTYFDGLLPITSQGPLSCGLAKLRDKLESLYIHYYSAYDHQTYKLLTYFEGLFPYGHNTLNQVVLLDNWSCDKLKSLYLNYYSAYGHQTRVDVNLL